MVNVARSITISRPVAEVFAYVSDVSHEPAWHTEPPKFAAPRARTDWDRDDLPDSGQALDACIRRG